MLPPTRASGDYYGQTNYHLLNIIYFWSPCSDVKIVEVLEKEIKPVDVDENENGKVSVDDKWINIPPIPISGVLGIW